MCERQPVASACIKTYKGRVTADEDKIVDYRPPEKAVQCRYLEKDGKLTYGFV